MEVCVDRMIVGEDRIKSEVQLDKFERRIGRFGSEMALKTRNKRSPFIWWEKYETDTPELMKFATQVLSLMCSASGCERNWSTFESIHTKKRNRPEVKRLHALFYVKYNHALRDRNIKRNSTMMNPVVTNEIESDDEWIAEKEPPTLPTNFEWFQDELTQQTPILGINAVRSVPPITYQNSLSRESITIRAPYLLASLHLLVSLHLTESLLRLERLHFMSLSCCTKEKTINRQVQAIVEKKGLDRDI